MTKKSKALSASQSLRVTKSGARKPRTRKDGSVSKTQITKPKLEPVVPAQLETVTSPVPAVGNIARPAYAPLGASFPPPPPPPPPQPSPSPQKTLPPSYGFVGNPALRRDAEMKAAPTAPTAPATEESGRGSLGWIFASSVLVLGLIFVYAKMTNWL